MPLRDHFRPPVEHEHSWDQLYGMRPAVIVQQEIVCRATFVLVLLLERRLRVHE